MRRRSPKRSGEQGARRQRTRRNAAPVRRQHSQDSEAASSAQSVSTIATNEVFDFKVRSGGPLGITFGQVRAKHSVSVLCWARMTQRDRGVGSGRLAAAALSSRSCRSIRTRRRRCGRSCGLACGSSSSSADPCPQAVRSPKPWPEASGAPPLTGAVRAGGDYRSVMETIRDRDTQKTFVLGFARS